jgi:hypothetical protein
VCFVDLDPCEVWREYHRTARKGHTCSCCRRAILKGETYLVHFSIFERRPTSEKCCGECEADRKAFADAHGGTLCTPSFLLEMLRECVGEEPESEETWRPVIDRIVARRPRRGG